MNEKLYQKMLKVREAENFNLKPCKYLVDEFEDESGKTHEFKLRIYQKQMIWHTLVMKRFIIGDATGCGKCVRGDTLISTDQGLVEIQNLHDWSDMEPDSFHKMDDDTQVMVNGEALPVKSFYYGGQKPTVQVATRYGFEIEGSQIHPLLVWRDGEHTWVEAQNLQKGDYVCIHRTKDQFPSKEPKMETDIDCASNARQYPLPETMTPELARLVGYLIGEAVLTNRERIPVSQCPKESLETHNDIVNLWEQCFSASVANPDEKDMHVHSTFIRQYLHDNGLKSVKSANRTVPDCILQSTKESNRHFLRAFFEGEGHVRDRGRGIELTTASEKLGRQIQIMLLRFGIVANRSEKTVKRYEDNDYWRLTMTGENAHIFRDEIGFVSSRKSLKLEQATNTYTNTNHDELSYAKLPQARSKTEYFYDPIESLNEGHAEIFDVEIDDPRHFFVGNGLVNHNTVESIANQCYLWEKEPELKPIVVTRKSAIGQWSEEIDKFTVDEIGWTIVEGKPEDRIGIYKDYFEDDSKGFLIVNYARLRNDERYFREFSKDSKFVMYGDEITAVKNTSTKTHAMMRALVDRSERAYGLTATLIKNNLEEGFGIFKVMQPELFPTKKGFLRDYCVTRRQKIPGRGGGRRYIEIIVGHKKKQIRKFRERIEPYYLGRAKHDVADELPVLTTKNLKAPISTSQSKLYEEALSGLLTVNKDTEEEEDKETTVLTQLIYTQQIVNSPRLIGREGKSGKEQLFLAMLNGDLEGQKVVVFSRFREMVHRLEALLEDRGYVEGIVRDGKSGTVRDEDEMAEYTGGFVRVTGKDEDDHRTAARQAFSKSDHTNLIFITMAGSDAINLQQAGVMLFYDMPWSAGDYLQCLDSETEILTPDGWKGRGEIFEGDQVAAFNPDTSEIDWSPVRSVVDRPIGDDEEMYELQSRHVNVRVTDGHRMLFKRKTVRNGQSVWPSGWRFETAEEMASEKSHFRIPASGVQDAPGVPLTDSELEMIGWYISDGYLNNLNAQLIISQANHQPQIRDLRQCLQNCGFDWSEYDRNPVDDDGTYENGKPQTIFSIPKGTEGGSRARNGWEDLEPYLDKDLSTLLDNVTEDQLAHLLRGIHLGDGAKQPKNVDWIQKSYHIFTSNRTFADRLQSLCVRRGYRCNISVRPADPELNRKEGYTLHIKKAGYWSQCGAKVSSRPKLSISDTDPDEQVWCVENDIGTLVTRRHGKVLIVGNCVGRMIRIGSPHQRVYAMHMLAEGQFGDETIDHHVMETLNTKMGYIEEALGKRLVTSNEQELEDSDDIVRVDENPVNDLFERLKKDAQKIS